VAAISARPYVSGDDKVPRSDILERARDSSDVAYRQLVSRLPDHVGHVIGYHRGWWEADGAARTGVGGKGLRPALALTCAAAAGRVGATSLDAAVCVELLHDWTLVHDDVMDGDIERRHRASVWAQFGIPRAVLVGDVLLSQAVSRAAHLPHPATRIVSDVVDELCRGQWADLDLAAAELPTMEQVLTMASQKTGSLLATACYLGARSGGGTLEQAAQYAAFGRELGIAYQAADDILGIWGDPDTTGKPAGQDLVRCKRSIPVVAALQNSSAEGHELRGLLQAGRTLSPGETDRASVLIIAAGGRQYAEEEVRDRTELALRHLDAAEPTPSAGNDLRTLAQMLVGRVR
jgi:geranylgeranyl diphosphate synthase type I